MSIEAITKRQIKDSGLRFRDERDRYHFFAWLARFNSRRAKFRVIDPYKHIDISKSPVIKRLCAVTFPWTVHQYPGKLALLGMILGVSSKTIENTWTGRPLSGIACQRAATWLEAKAAEYLALARELRAVPVKPRGFRKGVRPPKREKTPTG